MDTLEIIRVGLKANASILFKATNGNNLGGSGNKSMNYLGKYARHDGDIYHSNIIHLNKTQFDEFKATISKLGFDIEQSLYAVDIPNCDYSCFLKR